jgi:hypothetical protein
MLAEAQQSGLFPLAPIRRERVPCAMEDPVYQLYRREYFGYFPTCWRPFPAGWGCPSPEAPNAVAEFQRRERQKPPPIPTESGLMGPEGPPPEGEPGPAGRDMPDANQIPPLPPDTRSPLDLDSKPATPPPGRTPPGRTPPANANPLDLPPGLGDTPAAPAAGSPTGPTSSLRAPEDATADIPAPNSASLLALPDPAPAAPAAAPAPAAAFPPGTVVTDPGPSTYAAPAQVQAPRRTSLLGGFFGGMFNRGQR